MEGSVVGGGGVVVAIVFDFLLFMCLHVVISINSC